MLLPLRILFISLACNCLQLSPLYTMHRFDLEDYGFTTKHIYSKKDKLGTGASCDVFKGIEKSSGSVHALKVFKDAQWSNSQEKAREVEALTRLSHPNIVGYYGREEEYVTGRGVLVMEYCRGGSLYTFLQEPENVNGLEDKEFFTFLDNICQGLKYLRGRGFVHRDIKPGNILRHVEQDGSVTYKLADFGASKRVDDHHGEFMSLAGTEEYLHPAMYEKAFIDRGGVTVFNESADMWSLGVTIYHACAGDIPFKPYGGVRKNRSIMFLMITCKPQGTIAGHQLTPAEDIRWKRCLPETCQLSPVPKEKATYIIAGLLEADQGRQWTFQTFENEVKRLVNLKNVTMINTNDSTLVTLYISPDPSFSEIQEAVASMTDVPAHRQILLYSDRPLEDCASGQGLLTSVTSDKQEPIILVSKDEPEEEGRSYRNLEKCPVIGNRSSIEEDIKYASKVCVFIHNVWQTVHAVVTVSRGQRRAEAALWSYLKTLLLKMEKRFKLVTELSKEKQTRLEMMKEFEETRKYISHEANSSIVHRWRNARLILKQIQEVLWTIKSDITKLSTDIKTCEENLLTTTCNSTTKCDKGLKTLECYQEEAKSIWRNMRRRRHETPLSECEELMQKKQRKDIQDLCSYSLSLWTAGCFQEKNISTLHFLETKSKYLSHFNKLQDMEKQILDADKNVIKLSELLIEIWAFTGRAWRDVKKSVSRLYDQKNLKQSDQSLDTSASSGYSSLYLKTELSSTTNQFSTLLEELPEVEVFGLEDI